MKRKNLDPKEYGYIHTKQRLFERYALDITKSEYDKLCDNAKAGKNITLISTNQQKKGPQLVIETLFKNQPITLVWEDDRGCITTVLPRRQAKWER